MEAQNKKVSTSRALRGLVKKGGLTAVAGIVLGVSGASFALELGPSRCRVTVDVLTYDTDGMTSGTNPVAITAEYNWETILGYSGLTDEQKKAVPILVYVHGGGWTSGWQHDPLFYNRHPAAKAVLQNFNIASVDYRKFVNSSAKNPYPTQREDIINLIQKIDTTENRICLMGHSAGAHIAATVAAKLGSSVINCMVGVAGPYDLSEQTLAAQEEPVDGNDISEWSISGISNARNYRDKATEPATVSPALSLPASYDIPTLLFHGNRDTTVDKDQTTTYLQNIDVLTLASVSQVPSIFPNDSHLPLYFGNCSTTSGLGADGAAIVQFLQQHLY